MSAFSVFVVAVGSAVAVAAFLNRRSAEGTLLLYLSVVHRSGKRKKNVSEKTKRSLNKGRRSGRPRTDGERQPRGRE